MAYNRRLCYNPKSSGADDRMRKHEESPGFTGQDAG